MLRIFPAIDLIDGKCVRLKQGDYNQKTIYRENPLDAALEFEAAGISHLHLVDLDGAKAGRIINYKIIEEISKKTKLKIDFGGGLKSNVDIMIAFECGANQITGGSIAVKNPVLFKEWIKTYGAEKIILGADVKGTQIAINGWQETSEYDIFAFLENYIKEGIVYVICTDIATDGMLSGPSFELYKRIMEKFPSLKLVASGGVASIDDLQRLNTMGLYGAITGKAIYEGRIELSSLKQFEF